MGKGRVAIFKMSSVGLKMQALKLCLKNKRKQTKVYIRKTAADYLLSF